MYHLLWPLTLLFTCRGGDVAIDDPINLSSLHFYLKRSKCYQSSSGVGALIGKTGTPLCPVMTVLAYIIS